MHLFYKTVNFRLKPFLTLSWHLMKTSLLLLWTKWHWNSFSFCLRMLQFFTLYNFSIAPYVLIFMSQTLCCLSRRQFHKAKIFKWKHCLYLCESLRYWQVYVLSTFSVKLFWILAVILRRHTCLHFVYFAGCSDLK